MTLTKRRPIPLIVVSAFCFWLLVPFAVRAQTTTFHTDFNGAWILKKTSRKTPNDPNEGYFIGRTMTVDQTETSIRFVGLYLYKWLGQRNEHIYFFDGQGEVNVWDDLERRLKVPTISHGEAIKLLIVDSIRTTFHGEMYGVKKALW